MLFKPFGVKSGDVVDPDVLGNEFQEASRVTNETTWWQWADAAFTDTEVLAEGASDDAVVAVERTGVNVLMQTNLAVEPILIPDLLSGDLPDEDFFQIPYQRGLVEIDDTSVSWTSKYSELLFVAFSFQYVRERLETIFSTGVAYEVNRIRTQIRLRIDGGDLPGCGPYVVPFDGSPRGTGLGARSAAPVLVCITVVPAGTHRVWAVAGQKPSEISESEDTPSTTWKGMDEANVGGDDDNHQYGVGIGSRRMMVIRFPRGGTLPS